MVRGNTNAELNHTFTLASITASLSYSMHYIAELKYQYDRPLLFYLA